MFGYSVAYDPWANGDNLKGYWWHIKALRKRFGFAFYRKEVEKRLTGKTKTEKLKKDERVKAMVSIVDDIIGAIDKEKTVLKDGIAPNEPSIIVQNLDIQNIYFNGVYQSTTWKFVKPGMKIEYWMRHQIDDFDTLLCILQDVKKHLLRAQEAYEENDITEWLDDDGEEYQFLKGELISQDAFHDLVYTVDDTEESLNDHYEIEDYLFDSEESDDEIETEIGKKRRLPDQGESENKKAKVEWKKASNGKLDLYPKPWPNKENEWGFRVKSIAREDFFKDYKKL